jgi:hypothetical protein
MIRYDTYDESRNTICKCYLHAPWRSFQTCESSKWPRVRRRGPSLQDHRGGLISRTIETGSRARHQVNSRSELNRPNTYKDVHQLPLYPRWACGNVPWSSLIVPPATFSISALTLGWILLRAERRLIVVEVQEASETRLIRSWPWHKLDNRAAIQLPPSFRSEFANFRKPLRSPRHPPNRPLCISAQR